ncbi:MAG: hypothetical protein V1915_01165 [Candidatus Bathyarchaeota archaeon]
MFTLRIHKNSETIYRISNSQGFVKSYSSNELQKNPIVRKEFEELLRRASQDTNLDNCTRVIVLDVLMRLRFGIS